MKKKTINLTVIIASFLYLITAVALLEYVLDSYQEFMSSEAKEELSEEFLLVRANIESALFSDAFIANGLTTVLSVNKKLALDNFDAFAKALIQNGHYIRNIGVAERYTISKIYPQQGNEKAIGLDFRTRPSQLETVEAARLNKSVVLAGPLELVQGGQAIIARFPVFEDYPLNSDYWGGVSIVLNVEKLFEDAGLYKLVEKYDVAIRGLNGTGAQGPIFLGEQSTFEKADITSVIEIPGGSWLMAGNSEKILASQKLDFVTVYRIMGYIIIFLLLLSIILLYRSYHLAHRSSMLDELTGLRNRRFAFYLLDKFINSKKKQHFAVISIDLNGFKSINDTYGHKAGDFILIEVANLISEHIRATDVCCRLGGDEFLILLPRLRDKSKVESVIKHLKITIEEKVFTFDDSQLDVSLSAGYALYPEDSDDLEELIHISDLKMYQDKESHKASLG